MRADYKINDQIFQTDKVLSKLRSSTLEEGKVRDLRVHSTAMALERKLKSLGVDIPRIQLRAKVRQYLEGLVAK